MYEFQLNLVPFFFFFQIGCNFMILWQVSVNSIRRGNYVEIFLKIAKNRTYISYFDMKHHAIVRNKLETCLCSPYFHLFLQERFFALAEEDTLVDVITFARITS